MEKKNFFALLALGLGATRRAALLLALIFAFAGAQTAWGQSSCVLNFISQK